MPLPPSHAVFPLTVELMIYRVLDQTQRVALAAVAVRAVPVNEGFIDFGAFLRELGKHGFKGCVAYEMCSPLRDGSDQETLDRYARAFLEFMRTVRGQAPVSAR